jgi:putative restriction endonuclease
LNVVIVADMKFFVGVTNNEWFEYLAARRPDEVNFWRPRSQLDFRAIPVGAPFLFKLHAPLNYIAGGGYFVRHTFLPLHLAWQVFGDKNGVPDLATFRRRMLEYRSASELSRQIGCTILTQPFFFQRDAWITVPPDWSANIVTGKSYDIAEPAGQTLWQQVQERLGDAAFSVPSGVEAVGEEDKNRFGQPQWMRPRLGQGAFRVLVTDAYHRRCAMTGERTLPALEAAHIQRYSESGPHRVDNGLLLRSDLHHLFDLGYLTLTNDYRIEVSRSIKEEYENGRDYYVLHGRPLAVMPSAPGDRPSPHFLDWHRTTLFRR